MAVPKKMRKAIEDGNIVAGELIARLTKTAAIAKELGREDLSKRLNWHIKRIEKSTRDLQRLLDADRKK